ncbi:lysophospholipid acyltransferase family protein [Aestuariispira insulae]|nr:lysophospholipid acyltransferase family protein [Aestuariispira insulae]
MIKSDGAHRLACWLIAQYIRLVFVTSRWSYVGFDKRDRHIEDGQTYLVLMWHNRIALTAYSWDCKKRPMAVLASGHRDGQLVSRTLSYFSVDSVIGSSAKGAVGATKTVVRKIKQGTAISISPDGPRGPRQRMKDGPIIIARLANARITFTTYSVKRRIILKSWDRFNVPLPFNKGVFIWSDQTDIPGFSTDLDKEELRQKLEDHLRELTDEADRMMGHAPIPPGAPLPADGAKA